MQASDFKDSDGFKLKFEEKCSESDKKFFIEEYKKVDSVAEKKLHCTTCDVHIGTAPLSEKIIRTHQVLGVTQCNKCFAFYNSGEFGKGEDGSEYYCRWCGQGGEVFCCSTCPFVFCSKCIRSNLSDVYVKEIEDNDDWSCFVCNTDILKDHRAQHWALRNFMDKQLEQIQKTNVHSEDDLNNLLMEDVSTCCPRKKRKSVARVTPTPPPIVSNKRPGSTNGFMQVQPPAKKPSLTYQPKQKFPIRLPPAIAKPSTSGGKNSEIVCTPDIMGLFNDNNDNNDIPTTNMMPSAPIAPPPLVMRNNPRSRSLTSNTPAPPIYHNVNGYQIDLNHASRQEIFRLPNGKLIQVRKQTAPPAAAPFRPGSSQVMPAPRGPQFTIRQASPMAVNASAQRMYRPQIPTPRPQIPTPRARVQPQQRFTFSDGRVMSAQNTQPAPPPAPAPSSSTIFTQQNGSISVARAPQPNTPFGTSKTEFEDKIISGMEICQHTINKMITLTNSTSFKSSKSFSDLKDLYIHLQYLFSYTSGKFKTLQESITTGLESLAKQDAETKEKCDVDELEIVEEKTDVIEVMSDDEEETANAEKAAVAATALAAALKKTPIKHIQYPTEKAENGEVEKEAEKAEGEDAETIAAVASLTGDEENVSNDSIDLSEIIANDKKLSNKVVVKVEKLEDSKSPAIKQILHKIQERVRAMTPDHSSREVTPDWLFNVSVEITEGDDGVPAETTKEKEPSANEVTENEKSDESTKSTKPVDEVVDIPSDDDSPKPEDDDMPKAVEEVSSEKKDESDVLKIDNAPPAELMEDDGKPESAEKVDTAEPKEPESVEATAKATAEDQAQVQASDEVPKASSVDGQIAEKASAEVEEPTADSDKSIAEPEPAAAQEQSIAEPEESAADSEKSNAKSDEPADPEQSIAKPDEHTASDDKGEIASESPDASTVAFDEPTIVELESTVDSDESSLEVIDLDDSVDKASGEPPKDPLSEDKAETVESTEKPIKKIAIEEPSENGTEKWERKMEQKMAPVSDKNGESAGEEKNDEPDVSKAEAVAVTEDLMDIAELLPQPEEIKSSVTGNEIDEEKAMLESFIENLEQQPVMDID